MKTRMANTSWRFIHWFSWLAFVAALVHGFLIGTDGRSGIGLAVIVSCASAVLGTALWRFFKRPTRALGRTALSPLAPHDATKTDATATTPRTTTTNTTRPFPNGSHQRDRTRR